MDKCKHLSIGSISKETVNPLARPNELFKHYSLPEYDKTGTYAEEYGIDIQSAKFTVTNNCILVSKLNPWTSRVICGNRESNQIVQQNLLYGILLL